MQDKHFPAAATYMTQNYAYLEGHKIVRFDEGSSFIESMALWAKRFNDCDRHVGHTEIAGHKISTVFLGINHGFYGEPLWFETLIFDSNGQPIEEYRRLYPTWEKAEKGHLEAIEWLKSYLKPA